MTSVLIKKGNLDTETKTHKRRTAGESEDSRLQAQQRGLGQTLPSQPSEGTDPLSILILDSWPPELQDNKRLLSKPHRCFVTAALAT